MYQLDIDGDSESKPLTDGLLLIRYLFGFSGDSLISGAIGDGAERDTAEEVETYIEERLPVESLKISLGLEAALASKRDAHRILSRRYRG